MAFLKSTGLRMAVLAALLVSFNMSLASARSLHQDDSNTTDIKTKPAASGVLCSSLSSDATASQRAECIPDTVIEPSVDVVGNVTFDDTTSAAPSINDTSIMDTGNVTDSTISGDGVMIFDNSTAIADNSTATATGDITTAVSTPVDAPANSSRQTTTPLAGAGSGLNSTNSTQQARNAAGSAASAAAVLGAFAATVAAMMM